MDKDNSVLLGMSGGVDSTVAALLLQRQGYQVTGATLRLHREESIAAARGEREIADARACADKLGIPHLVLDWRGEFDREVLENFASEYDRGATPNPCVVCNRRIKFPSLLAAADERGIGYIATGHYADVIFDEGRGRFRLRQAASLAKDQSYVLYSLSQNCLSRLLLPLAGYTKEEIRALAGQAGLPVSQKADSQDICFVPGGDYPGFLERYRVRPATAGNFIDESGRVLGRHKGLWHYTIGQRKGLGISLGTPAFVKAIDASTGDIVLSDNESLFSQELYAGDLHWIDWERLEETVELTAKIRYAHQPQRAVVYPLGGARARVVFARPQRAITPGQAVVFYDGGYVAGGGMIEGRA